MSLYPIVEREMRVLARRPSTYWTRTVVALLVLGLWLLLIFGTQGRLAPRLLGQHMVNALGVLALGFCLLAGLFFTADCLSQEKRNGTLGLLFLTDLTGIDVVLGKLAATSLQAFYALLVIFPVMALSLLLGGVTPAEFGRLALVLLLTLFLSLAVGMFVSAISHDSRLALAGSFLVLVFLAGVLPAFWWLQHLLLRARFSALLLLFPSPGFAYRRAFDAYYKSANGSFLFWGAAGLILALGLIFLFLSCVILPRAWQASPLNARTESWRRCWRHFRFGGRRRLAQSRQQLEHCPYQWLAGRDRLAPILAWASLGLCLPLWLFFLVASVSTSATKAKPLFIMCMFSAFGLHQILKGLVALEATRQISDDRESGAWELLWVTSLSRPSVILGFWRALHLHFHKPLLALSLTNLGLVATVLASPKPLEMSSDDQSIFLVLFIGGWILLFMDCWALGWVGLAAALRARCHRRAVLAAFGRVMLIPWLGLFLLVFCGMNRGITQKQIQTFFIAWFLAGVVVDVAAAFRAQHQVGRQFGPER